MEHQHGAGMQFISRRMGNPSVCRQAVTQLKSLPKLRLVEMDDEFMDETTNLAAEFGLRGADYVYAAAVNQLNLPFVTFDVDQRQRGKGRLPFNQSLCSLLLIVKQFKVECRS